jgi:hypothetical protein
MADLSVEYIALTIAGGLVLLASALEFFHRIGVPMPFVGRKIEKRERERLSEVVKSTISQFLDQDGCLRSFLWYGQLSAKTPQPEQTAQELLCKYTKHYDRPVSTGRTDETPLRFITNWREIADVDRTSLERIFMDFVGRECITHNIPFDRIAILKYSNPMLGMGTAFLLKKPAILVEDEAGDSPVKEASWQKGIHGELNPGERLILFSDITASGAPFIDVKERLEAHHCSVHHAFVLVERLDRRRHQEDTPSQRLLKTGITLHSALKLTDDDITSLFRSRSSR